MNMRIRNPVEHQVHDIISARWSPYEYDTGKKVATEDLGSLFEAARWAMSASNIQPWRYIVANRDTDADLWNKVLDNLMEGNQAWAKYVPVLALGLVEAYREGDGSPNRNALHDLGTASAFLTFEATSRGLAVHQMAGIKADRIRETFALPDNLQPVTALAIGYAGVNSELDPEYRKRDEKVRSRKPLSDIILHGKL